MFQAGARKYLLQVFLFYMQLFTAVLSSIAQHLKVFDFGNDRSRWNEMVLVFRSPIRME